MAAQDLTYFPYRTPHGTLTICVSTRGVRAISFGEAASQGTRAACELSNQCSTELLEYFAGKRRRFAVPIDPVGTAFQLSVWKALQEIPYGESRTAGAIAAVLARPESKSAVGAAVRKNPLAIIVPDHRIVRADGRPLSPTARGRIAEGLLHMERNNLKG